MFIIPTTDFRVVGDVEQGGILLAIVPSSEPHYGVEIQRTSDDGTGTAASTGALSIAQLDPVTVAGSPYFDALPVDGNKRFYRARHIAAGYTAGAWTSWTTGHYPVQTSKKEILLSVANLTGRDPGLSGTVTKTLRVPFSAMIASSTAIAFNYNAALGYLNPSTGGSAALPGTMGVVLPVGVTLIGVRAMLYRNSTADTANWYLQVSSSGMGSAAGLFSVATTSTGWFLSASSALTEVIAGSHYTLNATLVTTGASTAPDNARFAYAEFDYTMPVYQRGY